MAIWVLKRIMNPDINYNVILNTEFLLNSQIHKIFRIGRGKACDILLTSLFVSRHHCDILFTEPGGIPVICDQKSENGTYVNGKKMSTGNSRELHEGCIIGVGVDSNEDVSCWVFQLNRLENNAPSIQLAVLTRDGGLPDMARLAIAEGGPSLVNGLSDGGPSSATRIGGSGDNDSIIILDSDSDGEVVVLSPSVRSGPSQSLLNRQSIVQPCVARPPEQSCTGSDEECVIIDNIPCVSLSASRSEEVSSVALKDTVSLLEVATEEVAHCSRLVDVPGVNSETSRPVEKAETEVKPNNTRPVEKTEIEVEHNNRNSCLNNNSGTKWDNDKIKIPVETKHNNGVPIGGVDLRVKATSTTNTTNILRGSKVEQDKHVVGANCGKPSTDFKLTIKSEPCSQLSHGTSGDQSTNNVQQEFNMILRSDEQVNDIPSINAQSTGPSLKKDAVVIKSEAKTVQAKSYQCHVDVSAPEDINCGFAVITDKQVTSPIGADIKPCFKSPMTKEVNQPFYSTNQDLTSVNIKSNLSSDELNYTDSDIIEILIDDDDEAQFPSSQSLFHDRGQAESTEEGSARSASPDIQDIESVVICDDTDDNDDDDNVDMWYCRLSQESGIHRPRIKVEPCQDEDDQHFDHVTDGVEHSPSVAGSSKDSGTSLSEVDSIGSKKRKKNPVEYRSESSSDNEDIFIHRRKHLKKAIVSTSEDEELPARRRLSEPVPSPKGKPSLDSDSDSPSRRRSLELPTGFHTKSSGTNSEAPVRNRSSVVFSTSKIKPSRYQFAELDPESIVTVSDTDSDSSSSRKKRQKLSCHIPVAPVPFAPVSSDPSATGISENYEHEKNHISYPVGEFSITSNNLPNNHKGRLDSEENAYVPVNLDTCKQATANTSDSEQEELMALVCQEAKSLDRSWRPRFVLKTPKLIEALPMPHRRSHQRGISENEAVRLFEKNNIDAKDAESLNKKSKKKEAVKEPKHTKEKSSTKGMKDRSIPIKRKRNVSAENKKKTSNLLCQTQKDQQKLDIKRKLKEIAEKGKADAEEKAKATAALNSKKVLSKPIVKMTDRSRTILLAQDLTSSSSCSVAPQAKRRPIPPQPQTIAQNAAPSSSGRPVPKEKPIPRQHKVPQPVTHGATVISNANTVPKYRPIPPKHNSPKLRPVTKLKFTRIPLLKDKPKLPSATNTTGPPKLVSTSSPTVLGVPPAVDNQSRALVTITNTLVKKSCLSKIDLSAIGQPKVRKRVRFISEITTRYYTPDNVPCKSVGSSKDGSTPSYPRLLTPVTKSFYDTLSSILGWNVNWFQEQLKQNGDSVPPVHGNMQRIQVLSQYTGYSDYWKVMNPLMLLNLWACISKDDSSGEQKAIYQFAIDNQLICKEDATLCRVYCHTLLNAQMKTNLPSVGDLIMLQLNTPAPANTDSQSTQVKAKFIFGYVERVNRVRLCDESIIHEKLAGRIAEPREILRLVLFVKNRNEAISKELLARIKVLSYIRPTLRNFQAIAALSTSPLCQQILTPQAEHYTLPNQLKHDELSYLKATLNKAQYAAVCRTAEVCLSDQPKICMIQGPPGTGKSFVIVNLISAVLKCVRSAPPSEHYRILVCAPSNAALDELVRRLIAVRSSMPKEERFKLVRTGVTHPAMDPGVKSISLEELVNIDIKKKTMAGNESSSLSSVQLEKNTLNAKIHAAELQLEAAKRNHLSQSVELAYMKLITQRRRLDHLESSSRQPNMMYDPKHRKDSERRILQGANIIASTLSSCTSSVMEAAFMHDEHSFGCCIIDEASQCCEPENLLPLLLGIKTLVLVGDPMQLPATTISKVAKAYGFGTSLFARLSDCFEHLDPSPIQFLHEQYRMHPNILRWPNFRFYSNRLTTAAQTKEQRQSSLVPYLILKHDCLQDSDTLSNQGEAELVNTLVNCITDCRSTQHFRIGVITPYNRQRQKLLNIVKKKGVTISTIDGFQGKESDIIIMSCVRTEGTGFMSDEQRLNVALTRAKSCMIICANFQSLNDNSTWRSLHDDAVQRNVLKTVPSANFRDNEFLTKMLLR